MSIENYISPTFQRGEFELKVNFPERTLVREGILPQPLKSWVSNYSEPSATASPWESYAKGIPLGQTAVCNF